ELHLVAVAVDLGGAEDRGHVEVAESAEPGQALDDLALLELELGRVADVLQPAAPATPEVGAGRLGAQVGGAVESLDRAPREPRTHLREADLEAVPGHAAGDEHDIAARPRGPPPSRPPPG